MVLDSVISIGSLIGMCCCASGVTELFKRAFHVDSHLSRVTCVSIWFFLATVTPISLTSVSDTITDGSGASSFMTVAYAQKQAAKKNRLTPQEMNQVNTIIAGVLRSPQFLTGEIHRQFWGIMNSRGVSNEVLKEFRQITSGWHINYQKYFWQDAYHSLNSGHPYKSKYRSNYEKRGLKIGHITRERVKADNELIEKIAAKQQVTYGGKKAVIDHAMIKQAMKRIDETQRRFDLLYSRNLPQVIR